MFRKAIIAISAVTLLSGVPLEAKKKPEMTPMELQAMQSHEYETTKEILFASVISESLATLVCGLLLMPRGRVGLTPDEPYRRSPRDDAAV